MKKANGQILTCHELIEKNTRIAKNYGVWLRYESRTGTHNMCAHARAREQRSAPMGEPRRAGGEPRGPGQRRPPSRAASRLGAFQHASDPGCALAARPPAGQHPPPSAAQPRPSSLTRLPLHTGPLHFSARRYKEYRETSINGAIQAVYNDLAGRNRARPRGIQIIRTVEVKPSSCKRANVTQFHDSKIKFPLAHRVPLSEKKFKTTFKASRPNTFY